MPMISSYCHYIKTYIIDFRRRDTPGEHHFVAAYLVPKLYEVTSKVPRYINPDGMKPSIPGDIVYYDKDEPFGIEVKLGTIKLTSSQHNRWIATVKPSAKPNLFIGIWKEGLVVAPWDQFREAYIETVRHRTTWNPGPIDTYGPGCQVVAIASQLRNEAWFPFSSSAEEILVREERLTKLLKQYLS
jgi:hypothetical protein